MSADPESAFPPDPNATPQNREKLPIPPAKRRYRRDIDGGEVEDAPPSARRSPRNVEAGAEVSAPPDDPLMDEIEALNARVRSLTERLGSVRRDPAPPPAAPEGRTVKYFRLARKQAPPPGAPRDPAAAPTPPRSAPAPGSAPPPGATPAPGAAVSTPAPPVMLPPPPTVHYAPWTDTTWHPGWLLASSGILALCVAAFFLGRFSNRPVVIKEIAPVPAPVWASAEVDRLDGILAAEHEGEIAQAFGQAKGLKKQFPKRQDLSLYTSLLQARAGELNNAEADLVRGVSAFAPPMVTATVQDHLGFIYARRRDFSAASDCFAAAAASNPFDPMLFYHWGESLRRSGKLTDAAARFREVLLRLPREGPESASLRECAALRLRLVQIELGSDADVKAELDEQLRQPAPSVYWLLTAVAYDLQHNDAAGALAAVQRAKMAVSPAQFDLLFNDYFLRALASHTLSVAPFAPEMTAERRKRLEESRTYFIDP